MIIEIHGGQFKNKGAQKMLLTVISRMRLINKDIIFVVDPCVGSNEELEKYNIKKLNFSRKWMGGRTFLIRFQIQKALSFLKSIFPYFMKNIISIGDVDVFIDIAGFAYSDKWGHKPAVHVSKLTKWYKKNNKKIIFLPQAFGPFENKLLKDAISNIIIDADLIYARDKVSLSYFSNLKNNNKVKISPDITFSENIHISTHNKIKKFAIVPNARMLDSSNMFWKKNYVNYLRHIYDYSQFKGYHTKFIIHDASGEDYKSIEQIQEDHNIEILRISDPWDLKKELSTYDVVCASRYHALVASLSSGVMCMTIGWAHKYNEIMDEFGLSDFILHTGININEVNNIIDNLSISTNYNDIKYSIKRKVDSINDSTNAMWKEIETLLN